MVSVLFLLKKRNMFHDVYRLHEPGKVTLSQKPITRSVQLPYSRATALSQVELFLDMPFPLKHCFWLRPYRSLNKNDGGETPLFLLLYFVFELSFSIIP